MAKIKCGIGDCQFSHELARVVGRHKLWVHKIQGKAPSSFHRRNRLKKQQALADSPLKVPQEERTLTVPEPRPLKVKTPRGKVRLECPYCPKILGSTTGMTYHLKHYHQEEQRLEQPIRNIEPLKRGRVSQNGHAPLPQNVTLTEAIHVLQAEVDAHLQVIARLKQLQGRQ